MNSTKTKQAWTVTNSNNSDFLDIDGESRICSIDVSEPVLAEQGITRREAEANAKLIASAPLLLEALKRFQDERVVNGNPAQRANNYCIEQQIQKAIQTATTKPIEGK